jgi:hypothetical protein
MTDTKKKFKENFNDKKWVRLLTVIMYVICVSLIAIILGLYYRFWWHPDYSSTNKTTNDSMVASLKLVPKSNLNLNITKLIAILEEQFSSRFFVTKDLRDDLFKIDEDTELILSIKIK